MNNIYMLQKRGVLVYRLRHACKLAFEQNSKAEARRMIQKAADEVLHEANYVLMRGMCLPSDLHNYRAFHFEQLDHALRAWR